MTLSEFKAWFEGFTETLEGAPTEAQFARIKARVAEITGTPVTREVFINHYRDYWTRPYYQLYGAASPAVSMGVASSAAQGQVFNGSQAMAALGYAEAKSLAA